MSKPTAEELRALVSHPRGKLALFIARTKSPYQLAAVMGEVEKLHQAKAIAGAVYEELLEAGYWQEMRLAGHRAPFAEPAGLKLARRYVPLLAAHSQAKKRP